MRLPALALLAAGLVSGCTKPDREAEVRAFIDEAVAAVEARRTGFFRSHVDPAYADSYGQTADQLLDRVRAFFLVNQQIEVLSRVTRVELDGDDFAVVTLQAAALGRRTGLNIDAELRTVELELARDGRRWVLIGADWSSDG